MTESTSEYKKRIEEIKQSIENEPYMAKMREDIAEGISKTGIRQATVEEQFQSVLDETTGKDVISAPEIILARGEAYATLGERLDGEKAEVNAQLQQTETELSKKPDKSETGWASFNTFDEPTRAALQGLQPGEINAVLGERNVQPFNTSFLQEVKTKNMFNKNTVTNGGYYNYTNNQFWANASYNYSEPIKLIAGQVYNAHDNSDTMVNFHDNLDAFISGVLLSGVNASFTPPANTKYAVVSLKTTKLDTFQIEEGDTFTGYEPYRESTYFLPLKMQEKGEEFLDLATGFNSGAVLGTNNEIVDLSNAVWTLPRAKLIGNTLVMKSGYSTCDPSISFGNDIKQMNVGDKISFRLKLKRLSPKLTAWRMNIRVGSEIGNSQGLKDESIELFRKVGQWNVLEGSYTFKEPSSNYKLGFVFVTSETLQSDEPLMEFDFSDNNSFVAYGDVEFGGWSEIADKVRGRNETLKAVLPPEIYTVTNDIDKTINARRYGLPLYANYLFNKKTDVGFEDGRRKKYFNDLYTNGFSQFAPVNGKIIRDEVIKLKSYSDTYVIEQNVDSVKHINTLMSTDVQQAFVLAIGDSVTEWGDNIERLSYYNIASELFEKEAFDKSIVNPVTFIGAKQVRERTVDYKGNPITVKACAEGRGGWTLHNYLRWTDNARSQETWDLTGLGDGSGTDYVGSPEQDTLMRKAVMNDPSTNPNNYFFDNDLNNGSGRAFTDTDINETRYNKFSIAKWLERYRTLDDNGNRLTLGNGTGTLITSDNINDIDVCTPSHIVIAMGHNDMENANTKGDINEYHSNIKEITEAIRSELTDVKIIFTVSQPLIGLWDKTEYPDYLNIPDPAYLEPYLENAEYMVTNKEAFEADNVYQLPNFWITPTAEAFTVTEIKDGTSKLYQPFGASQEPHPNAQTHYNYGLSLYGFMKHLLAP